MIFLLGLLVSLSLASIGASRDEPVVVTRLGRVRGHTLDSRSGRTFLAFTGIPYAKPPVGKLRFQAPSAVDPWEGELDARDDPPFCLQSLRVLPGKPVVGREDCLYLSVYTHNISGNAPVLFHIHGGAFQMGTSKIYNPRFLMDEDLVIVNINYRVGILGFLTFETPELRGNQGLKDQVMALRWVKDNIAAFGGNPERVTIIGESAGGASVYHHIVSPLSKGLFHGAIAESGSSYALWALSPPGLARTNAEHLMKLLRCPTTVDEAIRCIMNKDGRRIVSKIRYFSEWELDPILNFGPVLEEPGPEAFLVGPVSKWEHSPVPLFTGMTSAEGLMKTLKMLRDKVDFGWFSDNFERLAPLSLLYFASASNPLQVTKKIRQFYLPEENISMNDWVNLTTMYTDCWFTTPIIEGANRHKGDVYFYYFDYVWEGSTFYPADKDLVFGSSHVDEMKFLWELEIPFITKIDREELIDLSRNMVSIVSSFAANGTPSIRDNDMEWSKWTAENNSYVHINHDGFHLKEGIAENRFDFWKNLDYRDKFEITDSQGENIVP